jgi:hypothetical protein
VTAITPDLNPWDFCLWGMLNDTVYINKFRIEDCVEKKGQPGRCVFGAPAEFRRAINRVLVKVRCVFARWLKHLQLRLLWWVKPNINLIRWTAFPATSVCWVKTFHQPQYLNMKHMDHEACQIGIAAIGVLFDVIKLGLWSDQWYGPGKLRILYNLSHWNASNNFFYYHL